MKPVNFIDYTGRRMGMLTIISQAETIKGRTRWNVKCDCGVEKIMSQDSLNRKCNSTTIKSCGCDRYRYHSERLTIHGFNHTPELSIYQNAKRRAKEKGLPFDLKIQDIIIPEICPLLEIPIFKKGGLITENSPSLDRIMPHLGYVKENVWVISYKANAVKNNCTIEELELLTKNFKRYATR